MRPYERLWERLLTLLGTLGEVDASTAGGIRVTVDRREIEIVITEQEWEDLVSIPHGSFASAATELLLAVKRAQMNDAAYLVYDQYELHVCATPEKPARAEMEAEDSRLQQYLDAHPGATLEVRAYGSGQEPT